MLDYYSLAINQNWQMFQLDVKNTFKYSDLTKEVYREQLHVYVTQKEKLVCKLDCI